MKLSADTHTGEERSYCSTVACKRVSGGRVLQRNMPYLGEDQVPAGAGVAQRAACVDDRDDACADHRDEKWDLKLDEWKLDQWK
jgi:hypothetical protein